MASDEFGNYLAGYINASATGSRVRPTATIDVNVPGVNVREVKFVP